MRLIPLNRDLMIFWEELVYVEAALMATAETTPFAAPVTTQLATFNAVMAQDMETRRAQIQAQARVRVRDALTDTGIRGLHAAALFLAGQDRSAREFRTLFATSIDRVVRFALKRQLEVAQELVDKLTTLPLYADTLRQPHADALNEHIARGREALEQRHRAELARTGARLDIEAWKEDANALLLAVHSRLTEHAAQHRLGRDWPETFFAFQKSAATAPEEPPAADDPAPEPTTPS